MTIQIVIAEPREETRVLGPFKGPSASHAASMAMLLQELRPAATVVFIFGSETGTTAFTAAEILADQTEAERLEQAAADGRASRDRALGKAIKAKTSGPKAVSDIGPDYHGKLDEQIAAREQAHRDTSAIAAMGAAMVETLDEPPPRPPRPDPDEDELATTKAPRNPDDDDVARP